MIYMNFDKSIIIENDIFNLFINENMKFTHLIMSKKFDHHLINGVKSCFSDIKFLKCYTKMDDNILAALIGICKSIKELDLFINRNNNNYGIYKLIETPEKLVSVHLRSSITVDQSFRKILEMSLMKHASTIEYFKLNGLPITKILLSFENLKVLDLSYCYLIWKHLLNLSFPSLQILNSSLPIEFLQSIIENTSGSLTEIKFSGYLRNEVDSERFIQAIYQNCPKLKYLKLFIFSNNLLELENLLIKCQYLNGLYVVINEKNFDWNKLFEILTKSSPINLFKFKFCNCYQLKLESLKLFFDNWKDRPPMLLQLKHLKNMKVLLEKYKVMGKIKEYKFYLDANFD
ncbi:hypothetical protein C1645_880891 [Glomus cerebriforme]|uniref:F-box domain-containing protein n=1 Tax=Glomus cerebriforme TaxID=658196 RepID=A0A397SEP1_9GLOM|nr:hypothetical protein C1645_880891 [Glomus cerebriforme]